MIIQKSYVTQLSYAAIEQHCSSLHIFCMITCNEIEVSVDHNIMNIDQRSFSDQRSFNNAVLRRDFGTVMKLVLNGFPAGHRNDYALRRAAEYGDVTACMFLVEHGADPRARNDSALCWAAQNGHTEVIRYLLTKIPEPSTINEAVIIYAIESKKVEVIRILRLAGLSICSENIIDAAVKTNLEVIKYVLKYGTKDHTKYFIRVASTMTDKKIDPKIDPNTGTETDVDRRNQYKEYNDRKEIREYARTLNRLSWLSIVGL